MQYAVIYSIREIFYTANRYIQGFIEMAGNIVMLLSQGVIGGFSLVMLVVRGMSIIKMKLGI